MGGVKYRTMYYRLNVCVPLICMWKQGLWKVIRL